MKRIVIKWSKRLWYTLTVFIVLLALATVVLTFWFPRIRLSSPKMSHYIQQVIGYRADIGYLSVHQHGLDSEIAVHNVTLHEIGNDNSHSVHINHLSIVINWWKALLHLSLQPTDVTVNGVKLTIVQQKDGHYLVNGMAVRSAKHSQQQTDSSVPVEATVLNWLQNRGHITLTEADINWQPINHPHYLLHLPQLVITNYHGKHTVWGHIAIEKAKPSNIDVVAIFTGDLTDWHHLQGKLYLKLRQVDLTEWLPLSWHGYRIKNGDVNGQVWLTWHDQQLNSLQSIADFNHLQWISGRTQQVIPLEEIVGHFAWHTIKQQGWQLLADQVVMTVNGHRWFKNSLQLTVKAGTKTAPPEQKFILSYIDVNDFMSLLESDNRLPANWKTFFHGIKTAGALTNIHFSHHAAISQLWKQDELSLNLVHVAILPHEHYPGVVGLTGQLNFSPTHAALTIKTPAMDVVLPKFFNHPVNAGHVNGSISWNRFSDGSWVAVGNNLSAVNGDAALYSNVKVVDAADAKQPTIDMVLGFHENNPTLIKQYLPRRFLHPKLTIWLDQAFVSGKPITASILWHGPLQRLPYLNKEGTFLFNIPVKGLTLSYDQAWPVVKEMQGRVIFRNNSMAILNATGRIYDTVLTNVDITVPQIKTEVPANEKLYLNGLTSGDASSTLKFLRNSPMANQIGHTIDLLQAKGLMTGDIHLIIPLNDATATQVSGHRRFNNLNLSFSSWGLNVNQLKGEIAFTENGLTANHIVGKLFGLPLVADVKTFRHGNRKSDLKMHFSGEFNSADWENYLALPTWIATGHGYYQASYISGSAGQGDKLIIDSNLQGVKVNLPSFFAKSAPEMRRFRIIWTLHPSQKDNLLIHYGSDLHAALLLHSRQDKIHIYSGHLLFGRGAPAFHYQSGWIVSGYFAQFNWHQWQPYFDRFRQVIASRQTSQSPASAAENSLRAIKMQFGHLQLFGQDFPRAQVSVISQSNHYAVSISGPDANGMMAISKRAPHSIIAQFHNLYLRTASLHQQIGKSINPGLFPPLQLTVKEFRFNDVPYGNLSLEWLPDHNRLILKYLQLNSALLSGIVKGEWRMYGNGNDQTLISGSLRSRNIEQLLNQLKIDTSLRQSSGSASFALTWPQSPFNPKLDSITGSVATNLRHGSIAELSQSADNQLSLGKFLTVLSLRNILTGFTELQREGYPFDTMVGDFTFNQGSIQVNRCNLKGSVADISLKGRVYVPFNQLNLQMTAIPHMTDSLPLIAGVATVNPVIGAAAWVLNKAISPILNRTAAHTYSVTGTVKKPVMQRLNSRH